MCMETIFPIPSPPTQSLARDPFPVKALWAGSCVRDTQLVLTFKGIDYT